MYMTQNVDNMYYRKKYGSTLREESSQTNVILQYKLLAAILSAVSTVIVCIALLLHIIYSEIWL